ncbi:MAG TPA: Xaa-Pro peptidase family protein [Chloroflexota bacterium]
MIRPEEPVLDLAACATRRSRFQERLDRLGLDAALIAHPAEIYYYTGQLVPTFPSFLFLPTRGDAWLATAGDGPDRPGEGHAVEQVFYPSHLLLTMNPDVARRLAAVVRQRAQGLSGFSRVGWQSDALSHLIAQTIQETLHPDSWVAIDDELADQERAKDPDELVLLRKVIDCTMAAYAADRAAIAPGQNELAVLEAGHQAATLAAGEAVWHGGDYRCGEFGGPARGRAIEAGELYVIDAQTTYRGYNADTCRTFAVAEPTPLQQSVYDHLVGIHAELPRFIRPGGRGTELWQFIDREIRKHPHLRESGLIHHGGHGTGLRPHEPPDINRDREGIFRPGDVVSCEPGAYSTELNAGIRLENTFLVTETGCELLSHFPFQLSR